MKNDTEQPILGAVRPRNILLVILAVIGIGTVFYHRVEGFSFLDSVYFCVITLATVGYGDLTPKTDAGKIFTMFYVLIGVGIIASSVSYLLKRTAQNRFGKKKK
jgi:voltage-gated potassium channel